MSNQSDQVGRKLRIAREAMGLKQEDVAQKLGKTFQAVSSFESGRTRVDINTLLILCALYQADLYEILGLPRANGCTDREAKLLKLFRSASAELQNAAIAMLSSAQTIPLRPLTGSASIGMAARGGGVLPLDEEKQKELDMVSDYLDARTKDASSKNADGKDSRANDSRTKNADGKKDERP